MKKTELREVLRVVGELQGREFDEPEALLWLRLLSDLDVALVLAAVEQIAHETDEFMTPALVRGHARLLADERIRDAQHKCVPPTGLTDDQYLGWWRALRKSLIRGTQPTEAADEACAAIGVSPPPRDALGAAPTLTLPRVAATHDVVQGTVVEDER